MKSCLKRLRKVKNLTQADLALAIGVHRITIWHWEKHGISEVTLEKAVRLAEALDCSVSDLYKTEEQR